MASAIWFTDRSRYETGTGKCAMRRYLGTHAGPTGYGWTHKSESLPLATGTAFHIALGALTTLLKNYNRLPTVDEVRDVCHKVRTDYEALLSRKGFRGGMFTGPIIEETIKEQSSLVEGLVWAITLNFLPWLHTHYSILEVEQERLHFLTCSCGAGPLPQADHDARGCTGIALMIRTDILARHRVGSHLAYFEGKTTGWESDAWAEQWETKPQLALGTLDLAKIYGSEVAELFIVGANKGSRKKDKQDDGTPLEGMRRQQSSLAYGYCRPGNPPLAKDDWLPSYEWVDAAGETKRASRAHKKRGIWHLAESDWGTWRAYASGEPLAPEEFWARTLPPAVLDKVVFVLGPLNRQDAQLQSLTRGLLSEEQRWQQITWGLYETNVAGHLWASDEYQNTLDRTIPRSWNCRPFGKEYQCEFVPLCFKHSGWQDPASMGFVPRRPHHQPELDQAISRGLLISDSQIVEEEE